MAAGTRYALTVDPSGTFVIATVVVQAVAEQVNVVAVTVGAAGYSPDPPNSETLLTSSLLEEMAAGTGFRTADGGWSAAS